MKMRFPSYAVLLLNAAASLFTVTAAPLDENPSSLSRRHWIDLSLQRRQQQDTNNATAGMYTGPYATGGRWAEAFRRAQGLIDQMTVEEKVQFATGQSGPCAGNTGAVPRLGVGSLCLQDGPTGVRPARRTSQFPQEVTIAAAWNRELTAARATALAEEFRDKGVNFWLGPVTGGPLGRSALMGRNFEGFSPDSYLSGENSFVTVKAAQALGVIAVSKHWIAYEQETYRNAYAPNQSVIDVNGENYQRVLAQLPIDSILDDKATHETYMWAFAEAVRAGTGSIMCSYNRLNGTHACENDHAMNTLLKRELGFQGSVVSDWGGTWTTIHSALAGLDTTMPGKGYQGTFGDFFDGDLLSGVQNGDVPESRLDDMVLRILGPAVHFQGNFTRSWSAPTFDINDVAGATNNVRRDHYKVINKIGQESVTLLKNNRTLGFHYGLPLKDKTNISSIAVIGEDSGPKIHGYTSCGDFGTGCTADMGSNQNGTLSAGGGSGWSYPPYVSDLLAALSHEARDGGFDINSDLDNYNREAAAAQAAKSEVAIVSVNAYAREGSDRQNLTLFGEGDELIKAIAAVNNNTIVVIHNPGPVLVEEWIEHPNVTAVLMAYYPGQEAGHSLIPILFGSVSPSGRLPFTLAKSADDYPDLERAYSLDPSVNFTEGNDIDYKLFERRSVEPRYHFGHGLSYTTFSYEDLRVEYDFRPDDTSLQSTNEQWDATYGQGSSLYDRLLLATLSVTNTGKVAAKAVPQLYLSLQGLHHLRGFEKVLIPPGQTRQVSFPIRRKDVSVWSVQRQLWYIPDRELVFEAGKSVGHLDARASYRFIANQ